MTNYLEVKNLSKSFDSFQLHNITFTLPKGYIMGLIGPNGSGKTTTIKLILNKIKGQLTDERFAKLSAGYEAEQKGLEGTIKELSEQITQKTDKTINIDRFMKLVKKYTSFEELTPTLLNTFIEKILVHEVEIDAEGKKHQEIEIVYNFIGSVELPEEATHEEASKPVELPKRESRRSKKSA